MQNNICRRVLVNNPFCLMFVFHTSWKHHLWFSVFGGGGGEGGDTKAPVTWNGLSHSHKQMFCEVFGENTDYFSSIDYEYCKIKLTGGALVFTYKKYNCVLFFLLLARFCVRFKNKVCIGYYPSLYTLSHLCHFILPIIFCGSSTSKICFWKTNYFLQAVII